MCIASLSGVLFRNPYFVFWTVVLHLLHTAPSTVSAAKPRQFIIRRLSFESVPNAILVETGGMLLFNNIRLAGIAKEADYTYSSAQPYLNKGWANGLWPTVALAPGALVSLNTPGGTWDSCAHSRLQHALLY